MPIGNVIQQLGPVPVQTPPLANNGNFGLGWIQWFQALFNATKTIPQTTANAPANTTTPVAWLQYQANGQTYYLPLYQ